MEILTGWLLLLGFFPYRLKTLLISLVIDVFSRHCIVNCIQRQIWLVEKSSRKRSLTQEQSWLVESYPVLWKFLPLLS